MPSLQASLLLARTCKEKRNKPANGQRKKQGKKEEYAKNTLTKRAKWGQTKHDKHIKKQTSMLSNKKGCPRTTHRHMHEHVGKRAKMRRGKKSQKGGTKQARKKYQLCIKWRERCVSSTPTLQRCISQVATSKQALRGTDATIHASGPKDQQA